MIWLSREGSILRCFFANIGGIGVPSFALLGEAPRSRQSQVRGIRPRRKVQFVGGLLDQCVLAAGSPTESSRKRHVKKAFWCWPEDDVARPQVEEVLIHSLHLKAGHGPVQTGLGRLNRAATKTPASVTDSKVTLRRTARAGTRLGCSTRCRAVSDFAQSEAGMAECSGSRKGI